MKLGLHYWNYSTPAEPAAIAPTLAEAATLAEQAGVASFTVMDHFFQMDAVFAAEEPMLEAYTTLGYVAAKTQRMTLGVLVTGVMYRYPGLLAKTVTTLDVLSGGRARLGIGASWYEREQLGLGVPVVPVAERFERLEETLRICLQMWSADDGPFDGRHYQLAETINSPQPLSRPHPPIMIGGGERRRPCCWWPGMPTPATCSVAAAPTTSRASWTCCARTAPPRAATTTPSRRRWSPPGPRWTMPTGSSPRWPAMPRSA
ncbi:TIGR03560 family F420-dependent LLM class oxidoreductase [Micromonospora sp. M12]